MTKVEALIIKTHKASSTLSDIPDARIKKTVKMIADTLIQDKNAVLTANRKDLLKQDPNDPRTDRLRLTEERIVNISKSIKQISRLRNPSGRVLESRELSNGLLLEKHTVPLGVVGAIYE